ncbi:MAG: CHRD domain-containing protein [Pirellulales bacterium]
MNRWILCATLWAACGAYTSGATIVRFSGTLSGAAESPANGSPGTGEVLVTIDSTTSTFRVQANFSGLEGAVTMANIHCCTDLPYQGNAGVATMLPSLLDFPTGVREGVYDKTFDSLAESTYNPDFIAANGGTTAGARKALYDAFAVGKAYLNISTSVYGAGEIRGYLPEPAMGSITLLGMSILVLTRRRR